MTITINEIMKQRVNLSEWQEYVLCESKKLDCKVCLGDGGQAFTWESLDPVTWYNVVDETCVIIRDDTEQDGLIKLYLSKESLDEHEGSIERIKDYFRLNEDLEDLCREWSRCDPKFPQNLLGIRLLRQDPLETLFAFICSQNNLISRIKHLVKTLKREFGDLKGEFVIDGLKVYFYAFPKDSCSFQGSEEKLREWKFGYRAKYISCASDFLTKQNMATSQDLMTFRTKSYEESVAFLKGIPGIGPKVADCVALMSLDQLASVPIDTHIWRIARERYNFSSKGKAPANLNDRLYREIGDKFRHLFGVKAGWAHSILFTAELKNKAKSGNKKTKLK